MNDGRLGWFPDTLSVVAPASFLAASGPRAKTPEAASESRLGRAGRRRRPVSPTRPLTLPAWPRLCDQVKRALGPPLRSPRQPQRLLCASGAPGPTARGKGQGLAFCSDLSGPSLPTASGGAVGGPGLPLPMRGLEQLLVGGVSEVVCSWLLSVLERPLSSRFHFFPRWHLGFHPSPS